MIDHDRRNEPIEGRTLEYYADNAESFWHHTRDHDVSQNRSALLEAIARPGPLRILDFGCGPGRDLLAFREQGHIAVGLDGCAEFARMARAHSGCEVLCQRFLELDLRGREFDGIFANASLFHVPSAELPRVLRELFSALPPGGVLFCSNPRAFEEDWEGFQGHRYGTYLTIESWRRVIAAAGFVLEREFLRPPDEPPERQPWLAMVWRVPWTIRARVP
jgi:SAM-dependent methyltransferase